MLSYFEKVIERLHDRFDHMTIARSLILSSSESTYHCVARCVRRAYLFGIDPLTRKSYNHRKVWIYDRLVFLSRIFSIDVLGYALMTNHSHVMLRIRPDLIRELSDADVAARWLKLFPKKGIEPYSKEYWRSLETLQSNQERIKVIRTRLISISWFMKSLNEFIARRANREDECKGRFWESRFKCHRLCDSQAILSCAIYIDLNPIRAGICRSPETSKYTSAYERIRALKLAKGIKGEPQMWLSPISMGGNKKGFLNISIYEYLSILDITGREIRKGKRGKIPDNMAPILDRLNINHSNWLKTCYAFLNKFSHAIGTSSSLRTLASQQGKSWCKGVIFAKKAFTI